MALGSVEFTIAVLGLFLAGVLKGATGIGYSTCALPFLVAAVGLHRGMALVIVPAIVSNFSLMLNGGGTGAAMRRFWRFYVAIVPGIALGSSLLASFDAQVAVQLLGLLTLGYVVIAVTRPDIALNPEREKLLAMPAGFANGLLTGFTGSQIIPLMPYMMALRLSAAEQVQAINLAVTLTSVALGGTLLITGLVDSSILAISAIGAIPAIVGVEAGGLVRKRLSTQRFRQISLAMLALLGLSLTVQSSLRSSQTCRNAHGASLDNSATPAQCASHAAKQRDFITAHN
ncbi:MAG: sulfite exporter TauE/SafE family protein [Hyphomicrobiaceae bacterium]